MKKYNKIVISFLSILFLASCSSDFLDYEPTGVLSSGNVATAENADALVNAAYAAIGNDEMVGPITHQWVYGSVRSDDAYKGGGGRGDVDVVDRYEQYNLTTPDYGDWMLPRTWTNHYKAISRANFALSVINAIPDADYPLKKVRQAELRFLRAHSHFMLKLLFKKVPYITEDLTQEQILKTSNDLSNEDLWNKIADDFLFAFDNLEQSQEQVGRADKNAAAAYLAKLRLYQAYEQNDTHQVTSINQARLQEVIDYADKVTGSLETDFGNNFLDGHDNGPESIWAVQFSINDGTNTGRVSFVTGLNSPHGTPLYGCCGFHMASQNMVNAFRTDATSGLPLLDTFNDSDIFNTISNGDAPLASGVTIDPRIDHTVGVPGRPFKYKNTLKNSGDMVYKFSWARDPGVYGYFGNMKEQQSPDCSCYVKNGPFIGTSKNVDFIRYADVLLFKAEALIQLNRYTEALPIINQIRARAAASTTMPLAAGASDVYKIAQYASFPSKEYAMKALMFERRLEFGMEGARFFDLVRWGIAEQVLNAYLNKEKTKKDFLSNAKFTAGRDEYYPIPQREIDFTGGLYKQNPGY
ncbi:RagB/SusD family nutrient uptake outer membrane protein [Flavobacterium gawalongense]|uniref:RagB/SusD family nutrient uptake outer membrane protein n=1 Tax=Flavobacterium gawalongense TaxID=2594432 RepID=A0A553BP35_9FLAO|nr:RagB/SusD family nutrient uptake outer membrane protein [Flavobacterium gawalongense]TRX07214.1 RagB/SusD family nutrient uptake outer membrane protein [Flavobacterium gawalongense]TRX10006.1 RagB/SusD family nutrient uptake outer membrane protein [Flavobacterium gawalongense]TRX23270.1 RagB/SusD family nutrient uptake outer membrane protein [Flavobacterium gawalongense]